MSRAILPIGLALVFAVSSVSQGAITTSYQFNGNGNWSIDAVGSNGSPTGTVQAYVPVGSTVVQAFLYSSKIAGQTAAPTVSLAGQTYTPANFTALGINNGLQAWRADVTTQMQSLIGGGSASTFSFLVNENDTFNVDGEVLAIIYSNPGEQERTIAFLDGFASSAGDTTTVNFAGPVDTTIAGFEALLSLGIGYSAGEQLSQTSTVDVSIGNRRLTSSAGGYDDGLLNNGALITVGGLGDNSANPNNPGSSQSPDDELYNLAQGNNLDSTPFLLNGTSSFSLRTANPSGDDLVFFVGINVTAQANVNQTVPEPSMVLIWSLVGAGAAAFRRRRLWG